MVKQIDVDFASRWLETVAMKSDDKLEVGENCFIWTDWEALVV